MFRRNVCHGVPTRTEATKHAAMRFRYVGSIDAVERSQIIADGASPRCVSVPDPVDRRYRSEPVRVEGLGGRAPVERGEAVGERVLEPVVRVHQVEVAARPHNPSKP